MFSLAEFDRADMFHNFIILFVSSLCQSVS